VEPVIPKPPVKKAWPLMTPAERLVSNGANAEFIKHPGHQAETIKNLTTIGLWHSIHSSRDEISLPYQNSSKETRIVRKVGWMPWWDVQVTC
jgi:hypothetical protein